MILIEADSIGDAHNKIVALLNEKGIVTGTEDDETTKDMFEPTCIHIEHPERRPEVSPYSLFGEGFVNAYKPALYTLTPRKDDGTDATYTYGNRLVDYPTLRGRLCSNGKRRGLKRIIDRLFSHLGYYPSCVSNVMGHSGDGRGGGIDQIRESIINRLVKNPNSRRAIALTWVPSIDLQSSEPPCLQIIWFRINHEKRLCLVGVFRSNDMLSASGQNMVALSAAQDFVLKEVNDAIGDVENPVTKGWMELISLSPHMYFKRDSLELSRFNNKTTNKGLF